MGFLRYKTNAMENQEFVAQPDCKGTNEVAKWKREEEQYIPLKGEKFFTSEEARLRAHELNKEFLSSQNYQKI